MVDQERQEEGVKEIAQAGFDLRWAGHRLQGLHVYLNARYEDTIAKVEGRCDREARKIVLELMQEFQKHNNELAAHCMRLSNSNHGAMGLLKKSEDGRAAVTMRRAAELLVKGLANAEEEVHSLKTALKDAEGQRDNYKSQLAKTNSELTCAEAYAQMSMATGQTAASSKKSSAATANVDDPTLMPPPSKRPRETEKGKTPARQPQQVSKRVGRGTSTSDPEALGSGRSSRARPTGTSSSGSSNSGGGVGSGSEFRKGVKGKGRAEPSLVRNPVTAALRSNQESRATNSDGNIDSGNGTAPSAGGAEAASSSVVTSWEQRRDAENVDFSSSSDDDRSGATSENLGDSFDQSVGKSANTLTEPRSLEDEGKGSDGELGRKESGVEQQDPEKGSDGWAAPWGDGSEAGSAGGDVSVYDSDDAPSMFF